MFVDRDETDDEKMKSEKKETENELVIVFR